jgi:hypothetical protein
MEHYSPQSYIHASDPNTLPYTSHSHHRLTAFAQATHLHLEKAKIGQAYIHQGIFKIFVHAPSRPPIDHGPPISEKAKAHPNPPKNSPFPLHPLPFLCITTAYKPSSAPLLPLPLPFRFHSHRPSGSRPRRPCN